MESCPPGIMGMDRKNLPGAEIEIQDLEPGRFMDLHPQLVKNPCLGKTLFQHQSEPGRQAPNLSAVIMPEM